jgi:hypothetical protein
MIGAMTLRSLGTLCPDAPTVGISETGGVLPSTITVIEAKNE